LLFWVLLSITAGQNSKVETRNSKQIPNRKSEGLASAQCPATQPATCNLQPATRLWPCALVAALFGLHPMHVESVAWASERKDVLSAFFFFLMLWAYAKYVASVRCQGNLKLEIRNSKLESNSKSETRNPASRFTFHVSRFTL